jgi:hypothetical protein
MNQIERRMQICLRNPELHETPSMFFNTAERTKIKTKRVAARLKIPFTVWDPGLSN